MVLPSQILQKVPFCQDVYRLVGTKYPKKNQFLPRNHCQNESPSFPQFPTKDMYMYQSSTQLFQYIQNNLFEIKNQSWYYHWCLCNYVHVHVYVHCPSPNLLPVDSKYQKLQIHSCTWRQQRK